MKKIRIPDSRMERLKLSILFLFMLFLAGYAILHIKEGLTNFENPNFKETFKQGQELLKEIK